MTGFLKICIILQMSTTTANSPSGCAINDAWKSPLARYDTECPKPHPGQKLKPSAESGHRLAWAFDGVIRAISSKPPIQRKASNLILINWNMCRKLSFIV